MNVEILIGIKEKKRNNQKDIKIVETAIIKGLEWMIILN